MPTKLNPYTQIQGFGIITPVTMTSADVTLTPAQWINQIIVITGTLTANVNLIFPNIVGQWLVVNNTTGAHTITAKTAAGTGVIVTQGYSTPIYGDATNVVAVAAGTIADGVTATTQTSTDNSTKVATTAFVQTAKNSTFGFQQTRQDVTASRALNTSYTNSTGKPIFICVLFSITPSASAALEVPFFGNVMAELQNTTASTMNVMLNGIVLPGETYNASIVGGTGGTLNQWIEIR